MTTSYYRLACMLPWLLLATPALAELRIEDAYVRGLPPGVANTAAYLRIVNTGNTTLALIGGSTDVAEQLQLHGVMNHDGMLHMMPHDSLDIPPGGELQLESGGNHIMLVGLHEALPAGATVTLTLQFSDGSSQVVNAPVRSVLDE